MKKIDNSVELQNKICFPPNISKYGCGKLSNATITRIALTVFISIAALATITSVVLAVIIQPWIAVTAVPCLAGMGLAVVVFFKVKNNYYDPASLAQYRQAALRCPLEETVNKHGWNKMFQFGIPLPSDFPELYREAIEKKSLREALDFFERASKEYQAHRTSNPYANTFEIPHPRELKARWEKELHSNRLDALLQHYSIERLVRYEMIAIGSKEHTALTDCAHTHQQNEKVYAAITKQIEDNYQSQIAPFKQSRDATLQAIDIARKNQRQLDWMQRHQQIEHRIDAQVHPRSIRAQHRVRVDQVNNVINSFVPSPYEELDRRQRETESTYEQAIFGYKSVYEQSKINAKAEYEAHCQGLDAIFRSRLSQ